MGMRGGIPGHYFSPERLFWGGSRMCKSEERFFVIGNW